MTACWSSQPNVNTGVVAIPEQRSEFAFSVKEPEVYQANVVVTHDGAEDRFFIARRGDRWRRDHFTGGAPSMTELKTSDGVYLIDHQRKFYAAEPAAGNDVGAFDAASVSFFRGKEYRDFDEVGREGGVIRYKGRKGETSQDDILVTIDAASGMILKQEFGSASGESFVYELRDLKLEVDDTVFQIPTSFRRVKIEEMRAASKKK